MSTWPLSSAADQAWRLARRLLVLVSMSGCAIAQEQQLALQLEVIINGRPSGYVAAFDLSPDGKLSSMREELEAVGLLVPAHAEYDRPVLLDSFEGLQYVYEASRQSVEISTPDKHLRPVEIGPELDRSVGTPDQSMIGAVVNYGLVGAFYDDEARHEGTFGSYLSHSLQSLSLDTRFFGPYGVLTNSGFIGNGLNSQQPAIRLDTSWTLSDDASLTTYRIGDFVSSGPVWSRPVRLGGAQMFRNFGLRPDIITSPMPNFSGSAAVPSNVDVYIDNVKTFSRDAVSGPFTISNLPTVTGAGTARVVVRDMAGRETEHHSAFYATPDLLKAGLYDYSIDFGLPRRAFGVESNNYDSRPVAVASLRYGLYDFATIEAHAESSEDIAVAGAGANVKVIERALVSFGSSISHGREGTGIMLYGSIHTRIGPAVVSATSQRTFDTYLDLAAVIGRDGAPVAAGITIADTTNYDPPKAVDTISISLDLAELDGSVHMSFVRRATEYEDSRIISLGYSRDLMGYASLSAGSYFDLDTSNLGMFAGVSIPLGEAGHVNVGVDGHGDSYGLATSYIKTANPEPGSTGWRVTSNEGDNPYRAASFTYQGAKARAEFSVEQSDGGLRTLTYIDGGIVGTKHGVFLTNRVSDGFAVLDVGVSGVDVLLENRRVATTDDDGVALIPNLVAYQRSKLSIDPTGLPVDMSTPQIDTYVSTAQQSGVMAELRASYGVDSAVVVLKDAAGAEIPAGSSGKVIGTGASFLVGYDGRTYLEGLAATNDIQIEFAGRTCRTSFAFQHHIGEQVLIEAPPCI